MKSNYCATPFLLSLLVLASFGALRAQETELYKKFQPKETSRIREGIDWSIVYAFDTSSVDKPRLLLVGDSIVNAYHAAVREKLGGRMTLTFWASAKCVTDANYFRDLDLMLTADRYDVIAFNNGLHSLDTPRGEWKNAYRGAVKLMKARCPNAKIYLTLSTPLKDPSLTEKSRELNGIVERIAAEENLPTLDLFGLMDPLDREEYWSDVCHFKGPAIERQAEKIIETALGAIEAEN